MQPATYFKFVRRVIPAVRPYYFCLVACRAVFSAADEDGDGFLCIEEMAAVLQQLGRTISPQEVADIMA